MSKICCKGLYTQPCTDCGKQICISMGHAEYDPLIKDVFVCRCCGMVRKANKNLVYFKEFLISQFEHDEHLQEQIRECFTKFTNISQEDE